MASLSQISSYLPQNIDDLPIEERVRALTTAYQDLVARFKELEELWNGGRIKLREFTSDPVLADMGVAELAYGVGTGGGGEDELFIKSDTASIAVFTEDSVITA